MMVNAYLECAAWTEDLSEYEFTDESVITAQKDCQQFLELSGNLIDEYLKHYDRGQLGHDLWLTRNGHGAGFWDRDLGELGDDLTTIAEKLGPRDVIKDGLSIELV